MSHAFHLDIDRCSGCYACVVACMDQNDLEEDLESTAWRQVFSIETTKGGETRIRYVSLACMHCEDAPCIIACPSAALSREPGTHAVLVKHELCIGCHSCSLACPFGVPRFGKDGVMQKCDLCNIRLQYDLEPACVRVCPTKALRQGDPNLLAKDIGKRAAQRLASGA